MRAATLIVAVALVTLSPAVQAGDDRSDTPDRYGSIGSGRSSDTPVQGMTPWSRGNSDATTYYDGATGRVTGYDNHTSTSTIQRNETGRFEGLISRPNRQSGGSGR